MAVKIAERAAENFAKDGQLLPALIAEIEDDQGRPAVVPLPMPWKNDTQKIAMAKFAAKFLRKAKCRSYVFVSEVWFKTMHETAAKEFIGSKLGVSDLPDKEERILVIAENKNHDHVFLTMKIMRLPDGSATVGAIRDEETLRIEMNLFNGIFSP